MPDKPMDTPTFLRDVKTHKMIVHRDDGVYRHLKFRAVKDSWNQWFEILTWPGCLTIHGDMGTWTFARVDDMFCFFRSDGELKINSSYWCEKVQAESRFGGPSKKFSAEKFKAAIIGSLDGYGLTNKEKAEIIEALESDLFCDGDDEFSVRRELAEFERGDFKFSDTNEISGQEYTFHFLWCLHAIVWAIQQYDAARVTEVANA